MTEMVRGRARGAPAQQQQPSVPTLATVAKPPIEVPPMIVNQQVAAEFDSIQKAADEAVKAQQ